MNGIDAIRRPRVVERREPEVYIVGPRYLQHAKPSGYHALGRYVGEVLRMPIKDRWPWGRGSDQPLRARLIEFVVERVSRALDRFGKPVYSLPILWMELTVAVHMLRRRNAIYHVLYGETDVWLIATVARLTGNHVVASFHDGPDTQPWVGVTGTLLRRLSAIVLLGECQREFFESHAPASRIRVVPHGIDTTFFSPSPVARRSDEVLCITVGGHTRDHPTLATAIDLIAPSVPNLRFVAVSANVGNKKTPLEHDLIEHVGGVSDETLRDLYRRATVAVFAFEYAIANNGVLEAMACGTPIVATNIGGVAEYVPPTAGILVPPWDPERLAEAMLRVIRDRRLAAELSAGARENALRYSWELVADSMRDLYRDIASADVRETVLKETAR